MNKRLIYFAVFFFGLIAFSALLFIKLGRERLTLLYYKYATHENIIIATATLAALIILIVLVYYLIKRHQKKLRKKREEERQGIDLRDLFADTNK